MGIVLEYHCYSIIISLLTVLLTAAVTVTLKVFPFVFYVLLRTIPLFHLPGLPYSVKDRQVLDNSTDARGGSDLFAHTREEVQPRFRPHLPLGPKSSMCCSPECALGSSLL